MFITGGVVFLLLSSLWQNDGKATGVAGKTMNAADLQMNMAFISATLQITRLSVKIYAGETTLAAFT